MITPLRFSYVPIYIDAIQVTEENLADVANWCAGKICTNETRTYIRVNVLKPKLQKHTMAFVDDWVLGTNQGFKVYGPIAFKNSFIPAVELEEAK